jgi:hypothetical protein
MIKTRRKLFPLWTDRLKCHTLASRIAVKASTPKMAKVTRITRLAKWIFRRKRRARRTTSPVPTPRVTAQKYAKREVVRGLSYAPKNVRRAIQSGAMIGRSEAWGHRSSELVPTNAARSQ